MKCFFKTLFFTFFIICIIMFIGVMINLNTTFFRNIKTNVPYLAERNPTLCDYISKFSDDVNDYIDRMPSPLELLSSYTHKNVKINPDDIAANNYYTSDSALTFNNTQSISIDIKGSKLTAYGMLTNLNEKYLVYRFLDSNEEVLSQVTDICEKDGTFGEEMNIPEGTYQFALFTGSEKYGNYTGLIYNYIFPKKDTDGTWALPVPPVFNKNVAIYEEVKSKSRALKSTYDVCSDDQSVISLAKEITIGCGTDYDKALAIHDWVATNIYYDHDSLEDGSSTADYVATDVIVSRRAVCRGYATLFAALCRAVNVPCYVVNGYALGVDGYDKTWTEENMTTADANHAWNEFYAEGRWVITDPTWDSKNTIKNGVKSNEGEISHLYFDSNLRFFSQNHRLILYNR